MNFCQVEAFIFECIASLLFAFDKFNQSNVFRKLGYIVGIQKGDCAIFGTTDSVSAILLLGHHGIKTLFAVCMTTSCQETGKVVIMVLIATDCAVELRLHSKTMLLKIKVYDPGKTLIIHQSMPIIIGPCILRFGGS